MSSMYDLFSNPSIESFGKALRFAIGKREYSGGEDYASLINIENAYNIPQFVDALRTFLRRYDSYARRYEREHLGRVAFKPNEKDLDELIRLSEQYGVANVSAALVAHAIVRQSKEE